MRSVRMRRRIPVTGDDEWSKSGVVSEVASRVSLSKSEA